MVRIAFSDEEVNDASAQIPDGWGWHALALVNSDPTIGHRVYHQYASILQKIGVATKVPPAQGQPSGPWYAVTKLGQLVAESAGLHLGKKEEDR